MALKEIAPGVFYFPTVISNVYFVGRRGGPWVLIDTAPPGHASEIREAAAALYGRESVPEAILLTHGHPDHSGNALDLASSWDVDILVHRLEMPYLTGKSQYPPPDPTVGGFMAMLSRFVHLPLADLGDRVRALTPGVLPVALKGWEWHHTPGHTPGHVSFFRRQDGVLLAGDAITTVNLDSFLGTLARIQRVWRPPSPSTCDWNRASESVQLLAALHPLTIASGHGVPITGDKAVIQLSELATDFPFPQHGRYVRDPALTDETGIISLPPKPHDPLPGIATGVGIAAAAATTVAVIATRRTRRSLKADTAKPAA